jgi:hypothetical protein
VSADGKRESNSAKNESSDGGLVVKRPGNHGGCQRTDERSFTNELCFLFSLLVLIRPMHCVQEGHNAKCFCVCVCVCVGGGGRVCRPRCA